MGRGGSLTPFVLIHHVSHPHLSHFSLFAHNCFLNPLTRAGYGGPGGGGGAPGGYDTHLVPCRFYLTEGMAGGSRCNKGAGCTHSHLIRMLECVELPHAEGPVRALEGAENEDGTWAGTLYGAGRTFYVSTGA